MNTERPSDRYYDFDAITKSNFSIAAKTAQAIFTTDAKYLWDAYLLNIPPDARQHYNCNSCRHFIERYGGLVVISSNGEVH